MMSVLFPDSYVVWDLETSGFSAKENRILEIGCVVVRNREIERTWSMLLNHDIDIDEKVIAVHGITKEMCAAEGKPPVDALNRLAEEIVSVQSHVSHNGIRFDIPFLNAAFEAAGITIPPSIEECALDTAAIYKGGKLGLDIYANERFFDYGTRVLNCYAAGLKYNVAHVCGELGISLEDVTQHRALADALLTQKIFEKMRTA